MIYRHQSMLIPHFPTALLNGFAGWTLVAIGVLIKTKLRVAVFFYAFGTVSSGAA
jgi:hypothetical protein